MACSYATGTQFAQNSCAKHFLSKNYLQQTEILYRTVTSPSTNHLRFKATFVDNAVPNAYMDLITSSLTLLNSCSVFLKAMYCRDEGCGFPPLPKAHAHVKTRPLAWTRSTRCNSRQQNKLPHAETDNAPNLQTAQHFAGCTCLPCWDGLGTPDSFSPISRKL